MNCRKCGRSEFNGMVAVGKKQYECIECYCQTNDPKPLQDAMNQLVDNALWMMTGARPERIADDDWIPDFIDPQEMR